MRVLSIGLQILGVFLLATVAFDAVHCLLHRWMDARAPALRRIGGLHATHHAFLDRELELHEEHRRANLLRHVVPEYLTQVSATLPLLWLFPGIVVGGALALETAVFLLILASRGEDVNHRAIAILPAYRPLFFCLPEYHALHHAHPWAHFSSWIKLLDYLLGTGASLRGRRVAVTGADEPLGAALARRIARAGAREVRRLEIPLGGAPQAQPLADVDVLVLAQRSQTRGPDDSRLAWIEHVRALGRDRKLPPEVWAVCSGAGDTRVGERVFERHARRYYRDPRVLYRHIVATPDAHTPAGAEKAARAILFCVRRGFNYVPTSASSALGFASFRLLRSGPAPARVARVGA